MKLQLIMESEEEHHKLTSRFKDHPDLNTAIIGLTDAFEYLQRTLKIAHYMPALSIGGIDIEKGYKK